MKRRSLFGALVGVVLAPFAALGLVGKIKISPLPDNRMKRKGLRKLSAKEIEYYCWKRYEMYKKHGFRVKNV